MFYYIIIKLYCLEWHYSQNAAETLVRPTEIKCNS